MFSERMALEATLRRERVTTEARVYEGVRRYRQAGAKLAVADTKRLEQSL